MTVIEDMAQLVKYNSISGNKMNDVDVVYTMWSNLKKTEGMEVGQVINKICMGPSIYLSVKDQTSILNKPKMNFRPNKHKYYRHYRNFGYLRVISY